MEDCDSTRYAHDKWCELKDILEVIEQVVNQGGSKLVFDDQCSIYPGENSQILVNELKRLLKENEELESSFGEPCIWNRLARSTLSL